MCVSGYITFKIGTVDLIFFYLDTFYMRMIGKQYLCRRTETSLGLPLILLKIFRAGGNNVRVKCFSSGPNEQFDIH